MGKNHPHLDQVGYLLQDHVQIHQMDQLMGNESFPLLLPCSIVEIMLIGCIPEQVIVDFKNKLSCGTRFGSPHRIKNMDLPDFWTAIWRKLVLTVSGILSVSGARLSSNLSFSVKWLRNSLVVLFQLSVRLGLVM